MHLDKIHFGGKRRRSVVGDLDANNAQKMPCSSEACTGERCMDCNPLMKLEKLARSAAERSGIKTTEFSSVEDLLGISFGRLLLVFVQYAAGRTNHVGARREL